MGPIYVLILAPRAVPIDPWFWQQEAVAGCSVHSRKTYCGVGAVAIDEGRRKRSWGHLSSDAVQSVSCSGKLPHPGDVVSRRILSNTVQPHIRRWLSQFGSLVVGHCLPKLPLDRSGRVVEAMAR